MKNEEKPMGFCNLELAASKAQEGELLGVRIKGTSAVHHVEGLPFVLPGRRATKQGGMDKLILHYTVTLAFLRMFGINE